MSDQTPERKERGAPATWWSRLRDELSRWVDAALAPAPVPIPVPVRRR